MITLPGYTIVNLIYSGASTTVYRGLNNQDNSSVFIKVLNNENPSQTELAKMRREYEIARDLDFEGVVRQINLVPFRQSHALILEDFGGVALSSVMAEHKIDLLSCMQIALSLAETLGKIHQKGISIKILNHPISSSMKKQGR